MPIKEVTKKSPEEATGLTEQDVRFILENARGVNRIPVVQLARRFNLCIYRIYQIINRKIWRSVQVEDYTSHVSHPPIPSRRIKILSPEEATGLTVEDVRFILKDAIGEKPTAVAQLAKRFDLAKYYIFKIIDREIWQSVQVEGYIPPIAPRRIKNICPEEATGLTVQQVVFILENAMNEKPIPVSRLAKMFFINHESIYQIINRKIWRSVQVEGYTRPIKGLQKLSEEQVSFILENARCERPVPLWLISEKFKIGMHYLRQIIQGPTLNSTSFQKKTQIRNDLYPFRLNYPLSW